MFKYVGKSIVIYQNWRAFLQRLLLKDVYKNVRIITSE
jgi:hypothetical protein